MKKVAVIQSNYIPWKGYFDIIHDADVFVFHDDLQYTKNDWRNRNKIKTPNGTTWLTIPVGVDQRRLICEVTLPNAAWQKEHWNKIQNAYRAAPFFSLYRDFFEFVYLEKKWGWLSELNQFLIQHLAREFLGLRAEFHDSREYALTETRLDRLLELLNKVGADVYISGPSAASYIQPERFAQAGIQLVYKDYSGYPEYPQLYPPFEHAVSILDLLFQVGPAAPEYIWSWRSAAEKSNENSI